MRDAGCQMVMVGFESVSEQSLAQLNKRQQVRDIVESVDLFRSYGIRVHGLFIAGIDTDTAEQADRTVAFAKRHRIDTIQIMIETPLPGTRLHRRAEAEGRIITDQWELFDGHHAVMRPAALHPYQVQLETLRAMRRFYSLRHITLPAARDLLQRTPELVRMALRNRLPAQLPTLASLAVRRRWHELVGVLKARLPAADWQMIEDVFAVPAMRAYGRDQLARWWQQAHSRAHLDFLAGLP